MENCLFYRNDAQLQGADSLMLSNTLIGQILISDSKFTSNKVSNFILVEDAYKLTINNVQIELSQFYKQVSQNKTAGVHLKNVETLKIAKSSFKNLVGSY